MIPTVTDFGPSVDEWAESSGHGPQPKWTSPDRAAQPRVCEDLLFLRRVTGARLFKQKAHASRGGQNPSAVARPRCQAYGFLPWMFAVPPITQAVWPSRMAFSGRFGSTTVEDVALSSVDHGTSFCVGPQRTCSRSLGMLKVSPPSLRCGHDLHRAS